MYKFVNVNRVHLAGEVRTTALCDINLNIEAGEYVAITGPSGCGKSTLLNLLGLIDKPSSGQCWFEGQPAHDLGENELGKLRNGRIGFIFQSFNLIEELTVFENVELALEYGDVPPSERARRVTAMLERLGVAHRAKHFPSQLSGGQQQRVAIARALVGEPAVLLADEPTGNLDSAHGSEVMQMLREINAQGTAIVMVTHSPEHAQQASRVLQLRDGRLVGADASAAANQQRALAVEQAAEAR
ncbi:ABC transporter ATP-binding protein [Paucibacter sp. APW11]|uniref:ABC transporter ATP-binding protein n=1 Tax=Roseateles aquae TaxID=3077235 RepID=A0ABU3PJ01_9BURK|nr:ABC transporter ATP-binding protein [Paucibacter sp. APW11]MDT9002113.1 ABC transporter ATP-binding protein [Paucibacter sp. APW11]